MFNIRFGSISEVEGFQLFDSENQGDDVIIAESNGSVVGYMQMNEGNTDATVYFMESTQKGAGSAMMEWLKGRCDYILAHNVVDSAIGFYEKQGFARANAGTGYARQICMEWQND